MSDPYALHFLNDWSHNLATGDLASLVVMYEDQAVLLGTFGPEILRGQEAIEGYFRDLMEHPNLTVHVEDEQINQNVKDGHRVLSGDYEFSWGVNASSMVHVHARYTFAITEVDGKWIASTHHSSVRPS